MTFGIAVKDEAAESISECAGCGKAEKNEKNQRIREKQGQMHILSLKAAATTQAMKCPTMHRTVSARAQNVRRFCRGGVFWSLPVASECSRRITTKLQTTNLRAKSIGESCCMFGGKSTRKMIALGI